MNLYTVHGLLQVIAFAFLLPVGSLVALMRHRIGPSWLTWHVGFQFAGVMVVLSAVTIAHFGEKTKHDDKKEEKEEKQGGDVRRAHRVLGSLVVGLIFIQLLWAYLGRRYVPWNVWLFVHAAVATLILMGGWTNIFLAIKMKEGM